MSSTNRIEFNDDRDHSPVMDMVFSEAREDNTMKGSLCLALYLVLAIIWLPGFSVRDKVYAVADAPVEQIKRHHLKPPPQQPETRPETHDQLAKKVPVPDATPEEAEPLIPLELPPEPDIAEMEDWGFTTPVAPPGPTEDVITLATVGLEPPVFTRRFVPNYPKRAIPIRMQGYVLLEAVLHKDGTISDIKVLRQLGKGKFGFEDEAVKALKKWQFVPGQLRGKPTSVRMTLKIDFRLN